MVPSFTFLNGNPVFKDGLSKKPDSLDYRSDTERELSVLAIPEALLELGYMNYSLNSLKGDIWGII